jgi:hypothetical protein
VVTHEPDPGLIENYRGLASQRGWSMEQMADHVQASDPALAARLREQAATDRDAEPQERSAPPKCDAAAKTRKQTAPAEG